MGSSHWRALQAGLSLGVLAGVVDGLIAAGWNRASLSETLLAVLLSCTAGALVCALVALAVTRFDRRLVPRAPGELTESRVPGRALFLASLAPIPVLAVFLFWLALILPLPGVGPLWRIGASLLACSFIVAGGIRLCRPVALRNPLETALILLVSALVPAGAVLGFGLQGPQDVVRHSRLPLRGQPTPRPDAPNVLLIVLDTVRADRLSTYGYPRPTAPFLSQLAEESTVYLKAVSPAPWTLPSHASIFTGQYPSFHRATEEHRFLADDLTTLAEILHREGYATVAFSANLMVSAAHNLDQGFEEFYTIHGMRTSPLEKTLPGRLWKRLGSRFPGDKGARTVNHLVESWIERWWSERSRPPFFLFINYLEPHLPYGAPRPLGTRFLSNRLLDAPRSLTGPEWLPSAFRLMARADGLTSEERLQVGDLYDGGLAYQDEMLAALVGYLDRQHLLDETLLVIVSDHGENLGDHGGLLDHVFSMHQTVLHVPLLVRYPPLFERGLRYPEPVSTTALFATILEAAGVSSPPGQPAPIQALPRRIEEERPSCVLAEYALPLFGLSELAGKSPGFDVGSMAVRSTVLMRGDWKLVHRSSGELTLYNLAEDAAEERPLDPTASRAGVSIIEKLQSCLAAQPASPLRTADPRTELEEETQQVLRSLGYLD